jgi:putative heme-binding domain-containing protein
LNDTALFASIKKGVPGTDMPPTNLPDDQIWQVAAFVRDLSAPAYESKLAGSPDAGAEIFFGKGRCAGCHMVRGRGGYPGPDLTDIGALRTVFQLREALLKPSARIADGYEGVTVTLTDGSTVRGVARNNNNYSIQILDSKGELHLIAKDKVRDTLFRKSSMMPEDYGKRLTSDEVANVLAFLGSQSVRPPVDPGCTGHLRRHPQKSGKRLAYLRRRLPGPAAQPAHSDPSRQRRLARTEVGLSRGGRDETRIHAAGLPGRDVRDQQQ